MTDENTFEKQGKEKKTEQLAQRCTPSSRARLDQVLAALGCNKMENDHVVWDEDALKLLLDFANSKLILEGHKSYQDVITSINQYSALINSKLLSLIADLDNAEARIRSDYEARLSSKDQIIADLQKEKESILSEKEAALTDSSKSKDAQTIAEKHRIDAEDALKKSEAALHDKDSIIQMLTGKLKDSEEKLTGYDTLKSSESSLKEQVTLLLHQKEMAENNLNHEKAVRTGIEKELNESKGKLEEVRADAVAAKDEANAIRRDLEELQRSSEKALEDQKKLAEQEKALAIQQSYTAQQEAVNLKLDELRTEMNATIIQLREEKARLQAQLEILQGNHSSTT